MSKIRCLITALLLAGAPGAFAQPSAPEDASRAAPADESARRAEREAQAEARFQQADRNRDGKLSPEEMEAARAARRAERFAKMDRNRDGGLSREDLRQAREERRGQRGHRRERKHAKLQALVTDGDHALSRAELGDKAPHLAQRFDTIDANHDGRLTREEMRAQRPHHGEGAPRQ
jgi:Ca2+-binding EF-hand superfamily protein